MNIINIGQQPHSTPAKGDQQPSSAYTPHAATLATDIENTATATATPVISSSLVSSAVNETLLRLQENGTVFNEKDAGLMNTRGVSDEDRQRFTQIIQHAASTGGYNKPVEYIQSLPPSDIDVLRRVHSLAEASGVTNTTAEGAINLLLPRQSHVDINNDGLVNTGAATGFYFPPPNSPQSVKDAWEKTTEGMSPGERLMAEAQFMLSSISANIKLDKNGTPIGIYEYTDPEYTNIFGTTQNEWDSFLERLIAQSKAAEKLDVSYKKRTEMLVEFTFHLFENSQATG